MAQINKQKNKDVNLDGGVIFLSQLNFLDFVDAKHEQLAIAIAV